MPKSATISARVDAGIPNAETEEALQEAETGGNLVEYHSLDELRAEFE